MSYDLVIWGRKGHSAFSQTLTDEGFVQAEHNAWEFTSKNWVVSAYIDPVEDNDIPDDIFCRIRGVTYQVSVHVMPASAPASAQAKARRVARTLAEIGQGAVQDLQTDKVTLAKSARPLSSQQVDRSQTENSTAILSLVWCMNHSDVMTREGVNGILEILQRYLPEALPHRYGPYDPPRFKYAEQGRGHFVETYLEDPGTCIYCKRPAVGLSLPSFVHGYRKIGAEPKYWANTVEIMLEAKLLDDLYWSAHLPKVFSAISQKLQPFYGEARRLRGYEIARNGALMFRTRDVPDTPNGMSENSPVSPWWQGVPRLPAIACVIGAPYIELWAERDGWDDQNGLSFFQPTTWSRAADYIIPDNIAQRPEPVTEIRTIEDLRKHQENEALPPPIFPF